MRYAMNSLRAGVRKIGPVVVAMAMAVVGINPGVAMAADGPLEFNRDIRPILANNCFACHGADSAARKADLRLDQREVAVESGAISPGSAETSGLIERIFSDDPDLVMPPAETKKRLTAEQKETLKRWVEAGAEYQPHWSLIAPKRSDLPAVSDLQWVKNPIDRYVLARLDANGLKPAPETNASTLFRRLHFDITGLPPKPSDVTQFASDYAARGDAALSEWIDRLMDSQAWGEHRARYWLDAARYADTHGLHFDNYREMWSYRDWVIRAFNSNQPFDQFTIEQLAGDLLPDPTDEQLIATGFQRCNITTNEGGTIDEENLANYAADRVQTFGWVYLGLTTNCAQCHDHKFDPITMRDYYSLAAYFRNTTQGPKDGNVADGRGPVLVVPSEADRPRWRQLPEEIATAIARRDARRKQARSEFDTWLAQGGAAVLSEKIPAEGLQLHVPLNEGAGQALASYRMAQVKARNSPQPQTAPDAADPNVTVPESQAEKLPTADGSLQQSILNGPPKITWDASGPLGPAPVIKTGATFDVGDVGDFERDQGFSYAVWVKPSRNNLQAAIIARMDERAAHRGWDLWQNGNAYAAHLIDAWPGNGLKVVTKQPLVKPGTWQHVCVTYDGSGRPAGVKIFVDGQEQATRVDKDTLQADASLRTSTSLRIGQRSQSAVLDGAAVQGVRVYGRVLNAAEVKAIADYEPLLSLATRPTDQLKPAQVSQLYNHYLNAIDSEYGALAETVSRLESERETIRKRSPVTHIQQEKSDTPAMAHVLMRGAYDKPGEQVGARTPGALHPLPQDAPSNRLGLARWVIDPANPLTARVTVNRFWQQVFGTGLVATPEDFGVMGAVPSHPELLDWLAIEFQSNGWDVKKLFKLMLMSATYRQAAITTERKRQRDPGNRLLSRGPRFRMDAEILRDFALAASGLLSRKMYGPGTKPYQPDGIWDVVGLPGGNTRNYVQDQGENLYRRTLYTFWKRMAPPPNLEAFNAPSREVCTVRRERTNTPLQALVTLNDPTFVEAARQLAQRAILEGGDDFTSRLQFVARHLIARDLRPQEQRIANASMTKLQAYYAAHPEDARRLIEVGESKPAEQVDATTLAAWTMLVNQLMNLDEALNK